MYIKEGKGKLALFCTASNALLTPLLFIFYFPPPPPLPPTSTSTTKHVQQFGDERLAMVEGGWDPEILINSSLPPRTPLAFSSRSKTRFLFPFKGLPCGLSWGMGMDLTADSDERD